MWEYNASNFNIINNEIFTRKWTLDITKNL